jgi:DNA-directed RNA polymerase specialized sigma24 family protein
MDNNKAIVERFLAKDENFISKIYRENKSVFVGYFKNHYSASEESVLEIYQESMYIMYRKFKAGGSLTSKLSVFLIGIGKNLLKEEFRNGEKKEAYKRENQMSDEDEFHSSEIGDRKAELVMKIVAKLTEPCKSILEYFYWQKLKFPEILNRIKSFKNIDALKTYKYKCMQRMKKQLTEAFTSEGLM